MQAETCHQQYFIPMTTLFRLPAARTVVRAFLVTTAILLVTPAAHADTVSKRVRFAPGETVAVALAAEGLEVLNVRFSVESGTNLNPFTFKAGKGPQAFFTVRNHGTRALDFGMAVALYNEQGELIAAAESSHLGEMDPGDQAEMMVMFRFVKRKIFAAKTIEIVLETLPD